MKKTFYVLFFMSIIACGQEKNQDTNQKLKQENMKNPKEIVKSLIEAMKENDGDKIKSLFDENASQAYGDGPSKSGKKFFSWLDSDIIDRKGHVENANYKVDGNKVVVTGQYSSIGYTNKANFLFSVKDGKIMSWQMRY